MIDFYATWPHFLEHLAPIWEALDPDERGRFFVPEDIAPYAVFCGVTPTIGVPDQSGGPIVVASNGNLARVRERPVVYVAHGIGQQYGNAHASYVGGRRRGSVNLFLHPGELVAERERRAYPKSEVAAIGSPMMDRWHRGRGKREPNPDPIVAISFHWPCTISPESRSAFEHFKPALAELADRFEVIGHGHPRGMPEFAIEYQRLGIHVARDFEEVLARADLYACDNSSTIYEFASTDRPVVVMNAPSYRKNIDHGLRFWEFADVGLQCDEPAKLADTIQLALEDPAEVRARREEISDLVYAARDGKAAERAARAIEEFAMTAPREMASA